MYEPCPCGRTTVRMENLSGRTDDMLKIRGVNVFPSQIEEVLINTEGIGPNYEIVLDRKNHSDILTIKVEVEAEAMMDSLRGPGTPGLQPAGENAHECWAWMPRSSWYVPNTP